MAALIKEDNDAVKSPCIRNCCLDTDDVCVGCHRELSEIVGWRNKSDIEKKAVLERCEQRKKQ
jgi:predicted Fe-S protein YdhL (DUF1289 family)